MSEPEESELPNTVIVTATSEPEFLSGSGAITWQDLVSSPNVQGVQWVDVPLESDSILELIQILDPQLSDRGIEQTLVRDYDFSDSIDPNFIGDIVRHVHVVVPYLKDAKDQLENQGPAGVVLAWLGYKLSKHGDREKVQALSRMKDALAARKGEAQEVAIRLLRDTYSADQLTGLQFWADDLDDEGLIFTFKSTTAIFRVRVSLSRPNQLSARDEGYRRRGPLDALLGL